MTLQTKRTLFVNYRFKAVLCLQSGNSGGWCNLMLTVKVRGVFLVISLGAVGPALREDAYEVSSIFHMSHSCYKKQACLGSSRNV